MILVSPEKDKRQQVWEIRAKHTSIGLYAFGVLTQFVLYT